MLCTIINKQVIMLSNDISDTEIGKTIILKIKQ